MAPLEERLLAAARKERTAQVRAGPGGVGARAVLRRALRRLHRDGASVREIARAVGLSVHRVHQIVNGGDGGGEVRCSFCGAGPKAARKLIAGPGVYVCGACVEVASRVLDGDASADQERAELRTEPPSAAIGDAVASCSFCSWSTDEVGGIAASDGFGICRQCLDLCTDLMEEEPAGE